MKQPLLIAVAVGLMGFAGCRSSSDSVTPTHTEYQYSKSGASDTLVVVPMTSPVADLSKPDVSIKSSNVSISGIVRLRTGTFNPDAVVRIVVVDRHGAEGEEIRAILHESDTPGVLSYKAMFGPVPAKGSSLAISYEDWHPVEDYSGDYVGSGGGGGAGNSSGVKGPTVSSGSSNKSSSVKSSGGGGGLKGVSGPRGPK